MPSSDIFNSHSDQYEAWFCDHAVVYQSELAALRRLLPASGRGIELGVGSGLFAEPLGIRIGLDPSGAMLERARARGIEVVRGVAESIPFPDASFDYCLMVTAVCFLDDLELAFSEMHRIVRPGGVALLGFVDRESQIGREYVSRKDESLFYRNAVFYATEELVGHLTKAGFHRFRYCQTLFRPLQRITEVEQPRDGYGEGSFVVIRAER